MPRSAWEQLVACAPSCQLAEKILDGQTFLQSRETATGGRIKYLLHLHLVHELPGRASRGQVGHAGGHEARLHAGRHGHHTMCPHQGLECRVTPALAALAARPTRGVHP